MDLARISFNEQGYPGAWSEWIAEGCRRAQRRAPVSSYYDFGVKKNIHRACPARAKSNTTIVPAYGTPAAEVLAAETRTACSCQRQVAGTDATIPLPPVRGSSTAACRPLASPPGINTSASGARTLKDEVWSPAPITSLDLDSGQIADASQTTALLVDSGPCRKPDHPCRCSMVRQASSRPRRASHRFQGREADPSHLMACLFDRFLDTTRGAVMPGAATGALGRDRHARHCRRRQRPLSHRHGRSSSVRACRSNFLGARAKGAAREGYRVILVQFQSGTTNKCGQYDRPACRAIAAGGRQIIEASARCCRR